MKLFNKTAIASVLVLGSLAMGPASAITLNSLPGVTGSSIQVHIDREGVATLFGQTDSGAEKGIAERHVAKLDGVEKVINLVTFQ